MHTCCKNCIKHIGNTFPKKLVLISKNKIKRKSKCAICLTERTFIHEIEDKYWKFIFSFLLTDAIKQHEELLRKVPEKC